MNRVLKRLTKRHLDKFKNDQSVNDFIGEITKMYILADKLEATISLGVDPI